MKTLHPGHALAALLAVTALLYLSLWDAPPLNWDDDSNIFANPYFRAGDWTRVWRGEYFGLYVPVTSFVWQTLFAFGRGAAWPYRALNAALHVANTYLVYRMIRRAPSAAWPSVAGAVVFALHPVQVGAVAWISGGRDLLATFFGLLAFGSFDRARGLAGRAGGTAWFALGLLAKPAVAAWPFALAARVVNTRPRIAWRRHAGWIAAWAALAALVIRRTLDAQAEFSAARAWWERAWLAGDALWFYERALLSLSGFAANYDRRPEVVLADPWTAATGAAAVVILVVIGRRVRSGGFVAAAACALLPVSGLVSFGYQQTSGVADHYAYPALAFAAVALARAWPARPGRWAGGCGLAMSLVLALAAARRLPAYRSNAAFFGAMAVSAPGSFATAIGMSMVECAERGRYAEGVRWTRVALDRRPRDIRALANQAYCLFHAGDARGVAALARDLPRLDRAALARRQPTGYASFLASVGAGQIQVGELSEGFALICEATRLRPDDPTHLANLNAAARILRAAGQPDRCE